MSVAVSLSGCGSAQPPRATRRAPAVSAHQRISADTRPSGP
ncbi:hypothetical protein BURMUCF2_3123, partial [Burkholderia multivorans CF2]